MSVRGFTNTNDAGMNRAAAPYYIYVSERRSAIWHTSNRGTKRSIPIRIGKCHGRQEMKDQTVCSPGRIYKRGTFASSFLSFCLAKSALLQGKTCPFVKLLLWNVATVCKIMIYGTWWSVRLWLGSGLADSCRDCMNKCPRHSDRDPSAGETSKGYTTKFLATAYAIYWSINLKKRKTLVYFRKIIVSLRVEETGKGSRNNHRSASSATPLSVTTAPNLSESLSAMCHSAARGSSMPEKAAVTAMESCASIIRTAHQEPSFHQN